MDLADNPFFALGASPRDSRQRLLELASEGRATSDPDAAARARAVLTHPKKRLSAELAWLPGVAPARASEIVQRLVAKTGGVPALDALPPLATANVLAASLFRLESAATDTEVAEGVILLARVFEGLGAERTMALVNEDRLVAGVPEVKEAAVVEEVLAERRAHFRLAMKAALDELPSRRLVQVMTAVVDQSTHDGVNQAPLLIDDLVDTYQTESLQLLEQEALGVEAIVKSVRDALSNGASRGVLEEHYAVLERVVRHWNAIAKPIQVSARSRGTTYDASSRVGMVVRSLAVELFNKHDRLADSHRLTALLLASFNHDREMSEKAVTDREALTNIDVDRGKALARRKAWEASISYRTVFGMIFKDPFEMSVEGIQWKGQRWPLTSISRLRWGGVQRSVNGIPQGTTYTVMFGSAVDRESIDTTDKHVCDGITDALWRAVGVRIMGEMLEAVGAGKTVTVGNAGVRDDGIELERHRVFGANEQVFVPWHEMVLGSQPGAFSISKKGDPAVVAVLSYLDVDNVILLEPALRKFWASPQQRFSKAFD